MRRTPPALRLVGALLALAAPATAQTRASLRVEDGTAAHGDVTQVDLVLDTGGDVVEGVQAIVERESAGIRIVDMASVPGLDPSDPTGANADTVVLGFADDHALVGIVMDSDPSDNGGVAEVLSGTVPLVRLFVRCAPRSDPATVETTLAFVDGKFSAAPGGPALDNLVVVGDGRVGRTSVRIGEFTPVPLAYTAPRQSVLVGDRTDIPR